VTTPQKVIAICALALAGGAALGQTATVPSNWIGTWKLNAQKSTFGTILIPGAPAGFAVVSQTLKIQPIAHDIRISGDTVYSDSSGSHSGHDDNRLSLDGKQTVAGPVSLSFRRIDNSEFDIISSFPAGNGNMGEVCRFVFSPDGATLTETKTQTAGAAPKTSRFVLVFSKVAKREIR
jgi:hypothetical protein